MPGDDRKFNRRCIIAFMPTCSCGGASFAQTSPGSDGLSTTGVGDVSGSGDLIGSGVFVGSGVGVLVGRGVLVGGMDVWVGDATVGEMDVWVGDAIVGVGGSGVGVEMEVTDSGDPLGAIRLRNRKINNRIIATTSLNRS